MISKEEVKHIAELARLGLDKGEIATYQKELSAILAYFKKLAEADVLEHPQKTYFLDIGKASRKDEPGKKKDKKQAKLLLKSTSQAKKGYLKIKAVLWN